MSRWSLYSPKVSTSAVWPIWPAHFAKSWTSCQECHSSIHDASIICFCKQSVLGTLHAGTYFYLYFQKTVSMRTTWCWSWFSSLWDSPFRASCFSKVGVHVTFERRRLIQIFFATKDTLSVHTPVVTGLSEGPRRSFYTRSLTGVLKVWTVMRDSLPSPIFHTLKWMTCQSFLQKDLFTFKKSLKETGNHTVWRGNSGQGKSKICFD